MAYNLKLERGFLKKGCILDQASGKKFEIARNGLYLMTQGGLYDGRGRIVGSNSTVKNIPIVGMIL